MNITQRMKEVLSVNNYEDIYLSNGKKPGIYFECPEVMRKIAPGHRGSWYLYREIAKEIADIGYKITTDSNFGKDTIYFESILQRSRFLMSIGFPEVEYNKKKKEERAAAAKERRELLKSGKITYRQFQNEIKKAIKDESLFKVYEKIENTHDCRNFRCINEVDVEHSKFTIKVPNGENKVYNLDDFISSDDFYSAKHYVSKFVTCYIQY